MSLTRYAYRCRVCEVSWDSEHEFSTAPDHEVCHSCGDPASRDWRGTAVFPYGVHGRTVITNGPLA